MMQTAPVELDTDFEVHGEITKQYVAADGRRYLQGVISGVEEDRDGERVSEDCIKSMVDQVRAGGVAATASHQQDWFTTFGTAVEAFHDPATGEMVGKVQLPAEGDDPVADKAYREAARGTLGWSIGGKLKRAYFEKSEVGKRRKVLDAVALKHFCLTDKPSYRGAFAEVVAKTFEGEPTDEEFTEVEKDMGGPAGRPGGDSKTGDRNAGSRSKGAPMRTDDDEDDDGDDPDKQDDAQPDRELPKSGRHLACPNCGHEFSADLPDDNPNSESPDEFPDDGDDRDDDEDNQTRKTAQETDMPLKETLAELRSLVAKTDPEPSADDVTKTVTSDDIVAKAVLETNDRLDALEGALGEAFETIAKSHKALIEAVQSIPQGRKSLARVPENGVAPAVGHDDTPVEKTAEEQIAETDSPVAALKLLNAVTYGIR